MFTHSVKPPLKRLRLAAILTVIGIFGLVATGCGEDRSNLLPGDTVREIITNLDRVQVLADDDHCFEALEAAEEVRKQIEALGPKVDRKLKRSLLDGVTQLVLSIQDSCDTTLPTEQPPPELLPEIETGPTGPTEAEEPDDDSKEGTTGKQKEKPDGGSQSDSGGTQGGSGSGGSQGGGGGSTGGSGGSQGGNSGGGNPTPPPSTGPGSGGVGPPGGE